MFYYRKFKIRMNQIQGAPPGFYQPHQPTTKPVNMLKVSFSHLFEEKYNHFIFSEFNIYLYL